MVHSTYLTSWGKGGIYTFITSQPPTSEPPGDEVKTDGINVKVLSLVTADMLWPQKRRKIGGKKIFY